jgi:hypothetical protein
MITERNTAGNLRFGASGAVTRRNGSANLEVCTPQEVRCKPRLSQAPNR